MVFVLSKIVLTIGGREGRGGKLGVGGGRRGRVSKVKTKELKRAQAYLNHTRAETFTPIYLKNKNICTYTHFKCNATLTHFCYKSLVNKQMQISSQFLPKCCTYKLKEKHSHMRTYFKCNAKHTFHTVLPANTDFITVLPKCPNARFKRSS